MLEATLAKRYFLLERDRLDQSLQKALKKPTICGHRSEHAVMLFLDREPLVGGNDT